MELRFQPRAERARQQPGTSPLHGRSRRPGIQKRLGLAPHFQPLLPARRNKQTTPAPEYRHPAQMCSQAESTDLCTQISNHLEICTGVCRTSAFWQPQINSETLDPTGVSPRFHLNWSSFEWAPSYHVDLGTQESLRIIPSSLDTRSSDSATVTQRCVAGPVTHP